MSNPNNGPYVTFTFNGARYLSSFDKVFYSANCRRFKDHIVSDYGLIVTFRADNVVSNFNNLSIREIEPLAKKMIEVKLFHDIS
jgi:hypothetical protein